VPRIRELFELYEGEDAEPGERLSAEMVFEKLSKEGFTGGRTIVKEAVRKLRPARIEATERFETAPGKQGQMDWVNVDVRFLDGDRRKLKGFVYVLGYSRRMYVAFGEREDFHSLLRHHVAAFEFFQGCPLECLYDNMKTVVVRWEGGVPVFTPRFLLFATHYGFRPRACRPYRPETKGKVERLNRYLRRNFLVGRRPHDLADLNRQARDWNLEVADLRVHGTTRARPWDRFQEEVPHLLPLPRQAYDTAEVGYRLVALDGMVSWDGNFYSVPSEHVGELVVVRSTEREVRVLSSDAFRELARHEKRPPGGHERRQLPGHRPRRERAGPELDLLRRRFLELGEAAEEFLQGLGKAHPRTTKAEIRKILELRQVYATDDVTSALAHALSFQAFDARVVANVLARHATPRSLEGLIARSGDDASGLRRPSAVRQRAASEYQDLFEALGPGEQETSDPEEEEGDEEGPETEPDDGEEV